MVKRNIHAILHKYKLEATDDELQKIIDCISLNGMYGHRHIRSFFEMKSWQRGKNPCRSDSYPD